MISYQQAPPITVNIVSQSRPIRTPDLINTDSIGYVKQGDMIMFSIGSVSLLLLRLDAATGMWTALVSNDSTTKVIEITAREWEMYISLQRVVKAGGTSMPNVNFITFFELHQLHSR